MAAATRLGPGQLELLADRTAISVADHTLQASMGDIAGTAPGHGTPNSRSPASPWAPTLSAEDALTPPETAGE
jgi:hypothetical protein